MNAISTLPRWASAPLQQLANKEMPFGTQKAPLNQEAFDEFSQTAAGVVAMTAMDEVEGQDLAMGQPGVVVPQEGTTVRFEGDASNANGEVRAVVDATGQGGALYVRSGPTGFDVAAVMQTPQGTVAQAGYVEASPMGIGGYLVAGRV